MRMASGAWVSAMVLDAPARVGIPFAYAHLGHFANRGEAFRNLRPVPRQNGDDPKRAFILRSSCARITFVIHSVLTLGEDAMELI